MSLECVRLDADETNARQRVRIPADLVLLAMGSLHPVQEGMVKDLSVDLDARGNMKANEPGYRASRLATRQVKP